MAAEGRRQTATVIDQLRSAPHRFEFFQAVRLLQQLFEEPADSPETDERPLVGRDTPPRHEAVRFRANPSFGFAAGGIQALATGRKGATEEKGRSSFGPPVDMLVNFMGLTGPSGVLPQHFTTLLIQRRRANDPSLAAFQDLFNHRMISLFYRAWEKYRFPITYERLRRQGKPTSEDPFVKCILSLAGYGMPGLCTRLAFDSEAIVYYSGHFARRSRNADALQALLADYFGVGVRIDQLTGGWFELSENDRSYLPTSQNPLGQSAELGVNLTIGSRVGQVECGFRITLGPMTFKEYIRFLPNGDGFLALGHMVRGYVGPEFEFDGLLILQGAEVPMCRLGTAEHGPRLGWTTFVRSVDAPTDVQGAVLFLGRCYDEPRSAWARP